MPQPFENIDWPHILGKLKCQLAGLNNGRQRFMKDLVASDSFRPLRESWAGSLLFDKSGSPEVSANAFPVAIKFASDLLQGLPEKELGRPVARIARNWIITLVIMATLFYICWRTLSEWFTKDGFSYLFYWLHDQIFLTIKGYLFTQYFPFSLAVLLVVIAFCAVALIGPLSGRQPVLDLWRRWSTKAIGRSVYTPVALRSHAWAYHMAQGKGAGDFEHALEVLTKSEWERVYHAVCTASTNKNNSLTKNVILLAHTARLRCKLSENKGHTSTSPEVTLILAQSYFALKAVNRLIETGTIFDNQKELADKVYDAAGRLVLKLASNAEAVPLAILKPQNIGVVKFGPSVLAQQVRILITRDPWVLPLLRNAGLTSELQGVNRSKDLRELARQHEKRVQSLVPICGRVHSTSNLESEEWIAAWNEEWDVGGRSYEFAVRMMSELALELAAELEFPDLAANWINIFDSLGLALACNGQFSQDGGEDRPHTPSMKFFKALNKYGITTWDRARLARMFAFAKEVPGKGPSRCLRGAQGKWGTTSTEYFITQQQARLDLACQLDMIRTEQASTANQSNDPGSDPLPANTSGGS